MNLTVIDILVGIAAAVCWILGGILTGIAVSFYAATVVVDFYASGGMAGIGLNNMGGVNAMQSKLPLIILKVKYLGHG